MSPPQTGWPLYRRQSCGIHTRCLLLAAGQATSNVQRIALPSGAGHLHCLKEVLPTGAINLHCLKEVHINHWYAIAY